MTSLSQETGERLRIAHLTTVDMSLALLLATELEVDREAGHEVFGISAPGPYVERVEALGVQHVPINSLTRRWDVRSDAAAFVELFRTLRRLKLDVLHTHNPKTGVMGRIAGKLAGIPVVVNTCHGLWARPEDRLLKRALVYGAEALAIRFSDFELFQNAEDAKTLRRFLKPGRWKVVGNGIDLQRFQPDPEGRARVREEWGIRDYQLVVGTIGRRVREKGLAEYAEAAHRLGDKAAFIWVGPEDDTDAAADVLHQDAIRFVGERIDMPAVYSALDLFVLPSYREGFSRASMEAAACGLPMVLSDIRGCREIGNDGEHLLLAPPRDAAALTEAVDKLLGDQALRRRLGHAARERARSAFDQRSVARSSLATYAHAKGRPLHVQEATERVTVLHVLPQDLNRGAQMYAGYLRNALRDDPDQEHLLVTLFDGPHGAAYPDIALGVPNGTTRKVVDPRAVARLRRLIRERRPGFLVAHGGEALKYAIPAAGGTTSTIYYRIGLSTAEISRKSRTVLYGALARRAAMVVGVSSAIVRQLEQNFRIPSERLTIIPNGRDPEIYRPANPDHSTPSRPMLIWIGQLEMGKRPEFFLDIVENLREQGVDFDASLVGDGPLRSSLKTRSERLSVAMLGMRTDVPELLRAASVLVFTSAPTTEGMPGVLMEAGLTGLPTVSTPAAGVSDVIRHGQTGYVTESISDLTRHLVELLGDEVLRNQLGSAARKRCLQYFSVAATAGQWRELMASLLAAQAAGARQELRRHL